MVFGAPSQALTPEAESCAAKGWPKNLSGFKVYFLAAAAVIYAAIGYFVMPMIYSPDVLSLTDAIKIAFAGLALAGLRGAIASEIQNVLSAFGIITPQNDKQRILAQLGHGAMTRAVNSAKKKANIFLAVLFLGVLLTGGVLQGCSLFGSGSSSARDNAGVALADGLTVFTGAQAAYIALCDGQGAPQACADSLSSVQAGSHAGTIAFALAVKGYEAPLDDASIETLVAVAIGDVAALQGSFNQLKAKSGRKGDILQDVMIAGQLIAVAEQVYQQIEALNANGVPTNAALDALVAQAQKNDAQINSP